MTNNNAHILERELIETVENELEVMQTFCMQRFPCDVSTTVAMRMSRAVVAAACRIGIAAQFDASMCESSPTTVALRDALARLDQLNRQFEAKLAELPLNSPEWDAWKA